MTNRFNTVMARRLTSYSIYQLSWMTNQRSMVWFLQIHYSPNRLGQDTFQIKFLEWEADLIFLTIIISIMTTILMVTIIIFQNYFHVGTTLNLKLNLFNSACMDVHQAHQQTFKTFHQANLLELISSVNKRTWINLARTELGKSNIKVPSLLLVGDSSPFNEDAAELNSRLNPSITTFAKLQDRILKNKRNRLIP